MASPHSHPRRRYLNHPPRTPPLQTTFRDASTSPPSTPSLRKSATFHSPTSPSSDDDPILSIPSLPRRSPTSSKALEDILASSGRRISEIIGAVDRSLSGLESYAADSQETIVAEDFPVPRFMLNAHVADPDSMDLDQLSIQSPAQPPLHLFPRKHHSSDSGIGSTVTSASGDHAGVKRDSPAVGTATAALGEGRVRSGINGLTVGPSAAASGTQHALSEFACRQIQKHIILPIIREEKLKDFHPLVSGIPYRVARKEITCLRDLEKVLLWLAPKRSVSKDAFLNFCETSIQCIHTTVEYINEQEQRRPTDRPYTNGYFLDLVEQVRQYAAMLSESRAAREPGSDDAEHPSDEHLTMIGGLGRTGRPAELVRTKGGRSFYLHTGEEVPASEHKQGTKRSAGEESDEDDALRSMARRRKNALPTVKEAQRCSECDKVFKRPCDLTKHEKTHSRPWKCSDASCKYHKYGWPTEKECERHMNDKHATAPPLYKCKFKPCPYESKRESNCKQHMEKSHNWVYVRSKNNGKKNGPRPGQSAATPPTPQMSTPGSNDFGAPTPEFHDDPTYDASPMDRNIGSLHGSADASDGPANYSPEHDVEFDDAFGPFEPSFAWDHGATGYASTGDADYTPNSTRPSWDPSAMSTVPVESSAFDSAFLPQDDVSMAGNGFDWSNMGHDFMSMNLQLATPALSIETRPMNSFSRNASISTLDQPMLSNLSPGATVDAMLYSPYSMQSNDYSPDEAYPEYPEEFRKPTHDFLLFNSSTSILHNGGSMFQELPTSMPSDWSGPGTELAHELGMDDLQFLN